MENPLSGVMEWYQGLPQAAQIGIPVVGAGAVFLIAKGKGGGGGIGGSVVAGPFGASNGGGSGNGGNTPPPTPTPKPKPKPVPPPHGKPLPPVRPGHPGHGHHPPKPSPPGSHKPLPPVRPPVKPWSPGTKPAPIKAHPLQKGHLPSSHIIDHGIPASSRTYYHGQYNAPREYFHGQANSKASAVGYTAPQDQSQAKRAWTAAAAQANQHVTDTKVVPSLAKHPVRNKGLHNTVPTAKAHQHLNDQHRTASSVLATRANHQRVL